MVTGFSDCLPDRYGPKVEYSGFVWESSISCVLSSTVEVRWVCLETGFTFAEVLYVPGGEGLFRREVKIAFIIARKEIM